MARQIRAFWLVLSWSGFCHTDRYHGNGHKLCIFLFLKAGKVKTSMAQVPHNELLTNLASSSRTGEYWPSVIFVPTSGQYYPVRPSPSVRKRLTLPDWPNKRKVYKECIIWKKSTIFLCDGTQQVILGRKDAATFPVRAASLGSSCLHREQAI